MTGTSIETLTWQELEAMLPNHRAILLPLGARTKEHGLHLPLNNDWLIAEYLARRVLEQVHILALPTLQYGYYPAFKEYPGSVSVRHEVARDTVVDIGLSFLAHGIERMYVLNTGVSTKRPLADAKTALEDAGMRFAFTDITQAYKAVREELVTQSEGTHADEIETSMMLYIAPEVVRMELAKPDIHPSRGPGGLTRDPESNKGVYSPTGAYGDPTRATLDKGKRMVEGMVSTIVAELRQFLA